MEGTVANAVLGGTFTSRLVNEIRVDRGLSYGVSSRFDALKVAGRFCVSTFTKTETTREIIEVALGAVSQLKEKGFRPGEVAAAKRYITGTYPLRTEGNPAMAEAMAAVDLYELGADWVDRFRERIQKVTPQRALAVARKYLFDKAPALVVVGNAKQVLPQLRRFGRAQVVKPSELG
jgi:zinc protease